MQATDEDKGVNGQVKYSIVQQPNQKGTKFIVDEESGQITSNKVNKIKSTFNSQSVIIGELSFTKKKKDESNFCIFC